MAVLTVNGIVTRYANYRESDRMLNIFTAEYGMIGAVARGCRKPNSPLLGASEVFVYGEFVIFEKQGKYTVNSCDVRESFYPLRQDMDRFSAGIHMLEMINAGVTECEKCSGLLRLLYYALSYLAYTEQNPLDAALCFSVKALGIQGYTPTITQCARCGCDLRGLPRMGFDPEAGGAVCGACMTGAANPVSPLSLEAMRRMLLLKDEEVKKVVLPQQSRNELRAGIKAYAEHVLERKLKALDQLR